MSTFDQAFLAVIGNQGGFKPSALTKTDPLSLRVCPETLLAAA